MKLTKTVYVKVGERDIPVRLTNRAMIEYEELTGISTPDFSGAKGMTQFFYVTAKAGHKAEGKVFSYNYDEFVDMLDESMSYFDVLKSFTAAIFEFLPKADEGKAESKKKG